MAGSQNSIPLDFQVTMTSMTCNLGSYWLSHQKHVRSTHVNHDFVGVSVSFWQAGLPQNCDCSHQMLLCMMYCFLHSSWTPFLANLKFMAFMSNKLIKFPWVSYFKDRTTFHMFFFGGAEKSSFPLQGAANPIMPACGDGVANVRMWPKRWELFTTPNGKLRPY